MSSQHADARFVRQLHRALQHLYDPAELGHSPLIELLDVGEREDAPSQLRRLLLTAIQALKPGTDVPPNANAWRIYNILSRRYTEQFTIREVANNLALSVRHLARLESQGVQVLADRLWVQYELGKLPAAGEKAPLAPGTGTPSRDQELQWLRKSQGAELIDVAAMVQAALRVVAPLARSLGVQIACGVAPGVPHAIAQVTTLRQALVNTLTVALRSAPGGMLRVDAGAQGQRVQIDVRPHREGVAVMLPSSNSLDMARDLIGLSGGTLELCPDVEPGDAFLLRLSFPVAQQATVLVIDDNVDTLRLLERYLAGSRYRFVGSADPQQALPLAEGLCPQIIVLDVMLPGIDGWELLGRLHEHPHTRHAPIIVCTILAEEDLALALGAAALLHKPVTQQAFLAALDRQLGRLGQGSD